MSVLKTIKTKLFVAFTLLTLAFVAGCGSDNTSVTNPNPNTVFPTGTIQGKLVDNCTLQPIANAVIDIGVARATTNSAGQYVMYNVPATDYDPSCDCGFSGSYSATIDLRNVNNASGQAIAKGTYPEFAYDEVSVKFSSLSSKPNSNDSSANLNVNIQNPTPVLGVAEGDQDFSVGKLSSNIKGEVRNSKLALLAGYTVQLLSLGSNWDGNTGDGAKGHLVATTTTDANGVFTFPNVEAGQNYKIVATDTNVTTGAVATFIGKEWHVKGACDGQFKFLVGNDAIFVKATDDLCPMITAVSPTNDADLDPAADSTHNVIFTFSEPIVATALNTGTGLTASNSNGLYSKINVNFNGAKVGNIAHSITWNSTMTVLTVNIPDLSPASKYSVELTSGAAALLKDASGNQLANDGTECDSFTGKSINFTTFGAKAAVKPANLTVRNPASLDWNSTIILNWEPSVGAKSFNVYCRETQWDAVLGNVHPFVKLANTTQAVYFFTPSDFPAFFLGLDDFPNNNSTFVEFSKTKLTWDCYVAGVNADGLEGEKSDVLTGIKDAVKPRITSSNIVSQLNDGTFTTFTVTFSEPMDKAAAENPANYVLDAAAFVGTPPAITSVSYNVGTRTSTITLASAIDPRSYTGHLIPDVKATFISDGPDGITQTLALFPNFQNIAVGNGLHNTACVVESATAGTAQTTAAGDDVQVIAVAAATTAGATIVDTGANGICQTTAVADDVQAIPLNQGTPNAPAVLGSGTNRFTWTFAQALAGDDVLNQFNFITVNVPDVAGNALNTLNDQVRTDGSIH